MNNDIKQALSRYLSPVEPATVTPLGNGHINQTLLVTHSQGQFVLQRINTLVFTKPAILVNNALAIGNYLSREEVSYPYQSMAPLRSLSGNYLEKIEGQYWRAFDYIQGCSSIETMSNPEQAQQAAFAFATFSATLAGINTSELTPVIDNFHDLDCRLAQLSTAINENKANRLVKAQHLVDQFLSQSGFVSTVRSTTTKLQQRITHNDTKINNLLFKQATGQPYAVIDLDTCMPGYLMHDFGDMVRTCCSNLDEDATNISDMCFKRDIYDALYQGYLTGAKDIISDEEEKSLVLGAVLMPFIIGSRFLTDYLNGDVYFGVKHDQHNLQRATNQFAFYQLLKEQLPS